jgi:hypothetical protein
MAMFDEKTEMSTELGHLREDGVFDSVPLTLEGRLAYSWLRNE